MVRRTKKMTNLQKEKVNKSLIKKRKIDDFICAVESKDFTKDKQLTSFLYWCKEHNFFDNVTNAVLESNTDDILEELDSLYFPLLNNNGITIGIEAWGDFVRIGIDPTNCFNKIKTCSILIDPRNMSKRDVCAFYKILDEIILGNNKASASKWKKDAREYWHGDYIEIG